MKRLYPLLLLSLLFIGCSDKHDDQPNSPAVQLYELHYTTIDEKVVEPYRDDFGADIVSNTYKDGVGVIAFDAPITTIGERVFYNCSTLESITIPSSVTSIGSEAFYACTSIEGVTLPESVVSLGELSFAECDHLSEVYVQQSTPPTGGDDMFDGNSANRKIYVPVQSYSAYVSKEHWRDYADYIVGYDFEKGEVAPEGQRNYEIWYTSTDGNIVTPNTSNVFGATIVSNTYEDGKGVITFDGAVTTIGDSAFDFCDSLTSITIPDSVTTIGGYAFYSCDSLTSVTIPDSVTTIGDEVFYYCKSLTSVTIGDSVTTIGTGAFASCDSLKEFKGKYATDNGRCLIVDNTLIAYANKSGTEYTIPNSVTTIGGSAFYGCNSLTSVTIPDSVTTIGGRAFWSCDGLTSVTIPDSVTTIGDYAFCNCYSLTSVTIGDSVTTIGGHAFYKCESLTSITIPDSVTTIGDAAFYDCSSLTSVYCKATTPPTMGGGVFTYASLEAIYVPTVSVYDYKSAYGWRDYADYIIGYDFDKGEIATPKPANNEIWYTSTDGNIVTPYWSYVFGATIVSNTYEDGKGVITFDGAVTTIENWAFSWCISLTSITIPDSVTTIGYKAFSSCRSLTSVTIGDSVTTIGESAFLYCHSLTSITIPNSVTMIGDSAFEDCSSLTSVTIGDSVTTIGDYAFLYCDSLKEFKGKYATDNGRCLIKDNTIIAYAEASGTEYTIPDIVTTIGGNVFCYCYSLTSITIPNSVTTIGDGAFFGCSSLTSVTIPDSVTTIEEWAFSDCHSLTSVTIGDSVTTIGDWAFSGCTSLTSVYCKATTPPSIGYGVFSVNANSRKIYVPTASVNAYKTADGWRDYASYIVGYDF